jgi:hypothetical protein
MVEALGIICHHYHAYHQPVSVLRTRTFLDYPPTSSEVQSVSERVVSGDAVPRTRLSYRTVRLEENHRRISERRERECHRSRTPSLRENGTVMCDSES